MVNCTLTFPVEILKSRVVASQFVDLPLRFVCNCSTLILMVYATALYNMTMSLIQAVAGALKT